MGEFIAKESLSAEDFVHYSRQCQNDLAKAGNELRRARIDEKSASERVAFWKDRYIERHANCRKHGVETDAL